MHKIKLSRRYISEMGEECNLNILVCGKNHNAFYHILKMLKKRYSCLYLFAITDID